MDTLRLNQSRYSLADPDGNVYYRIDINCSVLQDTSDNIRLTPDVFVYSVDDSLVADTSSGGSIDGSFLRVASVADLSLLPSSKTEALSSNKTEYRSRVLQLSMPDLETAVNAIPVVVDRVNALVDSYIKFQRDFLTNIDTVYSLPQSTDSSVVAQYTLAYTDAVAARQSAETEQERLTNEYRLLQQKNELLDSYLLELTSVRDSFIIINDALSVEVANLDTPPSNLIVQQQNVNSLKNVVEALCGARNANLTASTAALSVSEGYLDESENNLRDLRNSENSALADLATYCPQVDASSL